MELGHYIKSSQGNIILALLGEQIAMHETLDNKSEHCILFILECLQRHQQKWAGKPKRPPFFLGLNGVQGAGKTVLVGIEILFGSKGELLDA